LGYLGLLGYEHNNLRAGTESRTPAPGSNNLGGRFCSTGGRSTSRGIGSQIFASLQPFFMEFAMYQRKRKNQIIHASKAPLRASDCPDSANECTRKHWEHILELGGEKLIQADAITVFCGARILAEIEDAEKKIAAQGRDVDSSGRPMQAPWSTRHQACLAGWLRYSKALRLDPSARVNDKAPEVRDGIIDIMKAIE
jgi:hypothetical protein